MAMKYAALAALLLAAGCVTEQSPPVTEVTVPGQGSQVYVFSYDIRESAKIPVSDEQALRAIFDNDEIAIVFNASSEEDNSFFRVVLINIGQKLNTYFAYTGRVLRYRYYYFLGNGTWYDEQGAAIEQPPVRNALWLSGPDSGARETSIAVDRSIAYLQGTSYKNLVMAGDRLAMAVMGIKP